MAFLRGLLIAISIAILGVNGQDGTGYDDIITSLPGVNFKATFKQYSGYLNATDGQHLFYWLLESQGDPTKDPIVLWLQGGPGCSSLLGAITENGPFHSNPNGYTLFENVFAWNKLANVIYMEAPAGVGFSYSDSGRYETDDDKTAYYNFHALRDFFYTKFPVYQTRDFFITGESYGGVYIPTLAVQVIKGIQDGEFPNNFKGVAIGNGILSEQYQTNSVINLYFYHGIQGVDTWDKLLDTCCPNVRSDECDFYTLAREKPPTECSRLILEFEETSGVNDDYNMYQDCYFDDNSRVFGRQNTKRRSTMMKYKQPLVPPPKSFFEKNTNSLPPGTQDMSHQTNYDSTDSYFGFQCWADETLYWNNRTVKEAFHVAPQLMNKTWCSCCDIPYRRIYDDMIDQFNFILQNSDIRVLVYNGDVDTVCNFLGDQWFIEREVAPQNNLTVEQSREAWNYRQQIAGFVKRFNRLDLLTVKGSGHFVPEDRPGPALQMIYNFVKNTKNYSKATGLDVNPKPLS